MYCDDSLIYVFNCVYDPLNSISYEVAFLQEILINLKQISVDVFSPVLLAVSNIQSHNIVKKKKKG